MSASFSIHRLICLCLHLLDSVSQGTVQVSLYPHLFCLRMLLSFFTTLLVSLLNFFFSLVEFSEGRDCVCFSHSSITSSQHDTWHREFVEQVFVEGFNHVKFGFPLIISLCGKCSLLYLNFLSFGIKLINSRSSRAGTHRHQTFQNNKNWERYDCLLQIGQGKSSQFIDIDLNSLPVYLCRKRPSIDFFLM